MTTMLRRLSSGHYVNPKDLFCTDKDSFWNNGQYTHYLVIRSNGGAELKIECGKGQAGLDLLANLEQEVVFLSEQKND